MMLPFSLEGYDIIRNVLFRTCVPRCFYCIKRPQSTAFASPCPRLPDEAPLWPLSETWGGAAPAHAVAWLGAFQGCPRSSWARHTAGPSESCQHMPSGACRTETPWNGNSSDTAARAFCSNTRIPLDNSTSKCRSRVITGALESRAIPRFLSNPYRIIHIYLLYHSLP